MSSRRRSMGLYDTKYRREQNCQLFGCVIYYMTWGRCFKCITWKNMVENKQIY